MDEPRKKSSPFPLPRATQQETAARPLSPMRRMLPIGVAASLILGGAAAGVGIQVYSDTIDDRGCSASRRHADPGNDRSNREPIDTFPSVVKASEHTFQKAVDAVRDFISPSPPPMVAGKMSVAPLPNPPPPPPPPVPTITPRSDIAVPGGIGRIRPKSASSPSDPAL